MELVFLSPRRLHSDSDEQTISEVAMSLEERYHVIEIFTIKYRKEIINAIAGYAIGQRSKTDAEERIRNLWRDYIIGDETGLVTMASVHRGNQPFVDTGDYFGTLIPSIRDE